MSNIIDFTAIAQQKQEELYRHEHLEDYTLPNGGLLMEINMALDILQGRALYENSEGMVRGVKIHRLLQVVRCIFAGIVPPLEFTTNVSVQESKDNEVDAQHSIYVRGGGVLRYMEAIKAGLPYKPSLEVEVWLSEIADDELIDQGRVYPPERLVFPREELAGFHERLPRRLVKNMNDLVSANGGVGYVSTDGSYIVRLPYSEVNSLTIALKVDGPITVDREEMRHHVMPETNI